MHPVWGPLRPQSVKILCWLLIARSSASVALGEEPVGVLSNWSCFFCYGVAHSTQNLQSLCERASEVSCVCLSGPVWSVADPLQGCKVILQTSGAARVLTSNRGLPSSEQESACQTQQWHNGKLLPPRSSHI